MTIYQPRYFPQLHYFNRILSSDVYVILDSAQYTKSLVHFLLNGNKRHPSYQSDTLIKSSNGRLMLTVPVKHDGLKPINETVIDYTSGWQRKHSATIYTVYGRASQFSDIFPSLDTLLKHKYNTLADLNIASIIWALSRLLQLPDNSSELSLDMINEMLVKYPKIPLKKIIRDKKTGVTRPSGNSKGTEWTIAICKAMKADQYIYGGTAKEGYMDLEAYERDGIRTIQQDWKCPHYRQLFTESIGFMPNLSIIDLLMNLKPEDGFKVLTGLCKEDFG